MGNWNATVAASAAFTSVPAITMVLSPAAGGLPNDFPADVLYEFRLASLGVKALL